MKVSMQWLAEYVDLSGISADDLGERMTRGGVEIDAIDKRGASLSGVVVGKVLRCEQHPGADKLRVCEVDLGEAAPVQIVCGAPNVAAGQLVPVATVGAKLPGGLKIKRAKLRGVESHGMICSAEELGLPKQVLPKAMQEGILVMPPDCAAPGDDALPLLALNDDILELDLTPNRADCLSMLGVAWEVAALYGDREVKWPEVEVAESAELGETTGQVRIVIEHAAGCSHYTARWIEGVKIGPSPLWLQNRLIAAGIRPVNNVVDVTNYVMLEYGQPLHAFDADQVRGSEIHVRFAREGEQLTTIDHVERKLRSDMLVIADKAGPIALAGVMGGVDSEVTETTTRILLESACFDGQTVRRTARDLGLRSEASARFEKGVDPERVLPALHRAAQLIIEVAGGQAAQGVAQAGEVLPATPPIEITVAKVNRVLGTSLSVTEAKTLWERLGFRVEGADDADAESTLLVHVPSRRGDVRRDVDLIEEVARLYGYDQIPVTLPVGVTTAGGLTREQWLQRKVRAMLNGAGWHETVQYSFADGRVEKVWQGLRSDVVPIPLAMPMSDERSVLRTSLVPHLVDCAVYNVNRGQSRLALLEIARVFWRAGEEHADDWQHEERLLLSGLLLGTREPRHWQAADHRVAFFDVKGIVEQLLAALGIDDVQWRQAQRPAMHPGRTAELYGCGVMGRPMGIVGQLHPQWQDELGLDDAYVFELDFTAMLAAAAADVTYRALPRVPGVTRDLAVVCHKGTTAVYWAQLLREAAGECLESLEVFDVYEGQGLPEGHKSLAFSLRFRHPERTLTDEEVQGFVDQAVAALRQAGADLRQ